MNVVVPRCRRSLAAPVTLAIVSTFALSSASGDPYLKHLYDSRHDSAAQRRFRQLAPMPAGVVYIQQPGEGEPEMRKHFRTMKQLGFNALKQILPTPGWTVERIQLIALDEGIIPWWYGEGGYELVTPALRQRLDIPADLPMSDVLAHPAMVRYQHDVLRRRILRTTEFIQNSDRGRFLRTSSVAFDPEVGGRGVELTERGEQLFLKWLRQSYGSLEQLNRSWNQHHAGLAFRGVGFRSWQEVADHWADFNKREYRHVRDVLRFKADHSLARINRLTDELKAFDPCMPFRGGGELGLFLPSAWYGVDLEGIADCMTEHGAFYPSMHFSWHFDQVDHEIVRPLYMQASLMADLFKGGWTGGWESSGGPQQLEGEAGDVTPNSYYVGPGELLQLYLSQMAAGFKGFGVWCWNSRSAGKEAGQYSLLTRNGGVTDRAVRLGQLGRAMQTHRFELWRARKEPLVGVLYDWENEAVWAVMSIIGRESFRLKPVEARIGVSRALINANIPFEYVTPGDLRHGLALRYPVIYLPAMLGLQSEVLDVLADYVRQGGRLVMDLPSAWYDEFTQRFPTGEGSKFAEVFGVSLDDFQYSGVNRTLSLNGETLAGFVANLTPTTARVLARYDNGRPAVVENRLDRGTALLLAFEASLACHRPGHSATEKRLLDYALGDLKPAYACDEAIVYRLAAPRADHYFLLNDGPARSVRLRFASSPKLLRITDAITGENLALNQPIELAAHDARWLRCQIEIAKE